MRRIIHVDMDAFFAAVEQKRHPELIGKPIVIGGDGDPTKRGVVSTASYEARKYGIHSAMPLRHAYRLCPEAVFLPVDYNEYAKVSGKIKAILRGFTPLVEDVGIDEAFLDITDIDMESEEMVKRIKDKITEETGLSCSIGIGPNKLLAKIASDMKKPDGLTIISPENITKMIWPLPVRKLWGVGPKTEKRLQDIGITTIGDLASIPLEKLTGDFGQSYGNYLYEASRGIDETPLITRWEPKSMSRETTFQRDTDNWNVIAKNLANLTKDVVDSMKESGYQGKTITIKIRYSNFETHTRAKTLDEFTDSLDTIRKAAFEVLGRIELKKKVRLIGMRISNLKKV
jgi:DNA polymerase-4